MDSDFIKVSRKKKNFVKKNSIILDSTLNQIDYTKYFNMIKIYREEIEISLFFQKLKCLLNEFQIDGRIEKIVSYGLGDISNCKISQYQFALLLSLASFIQLPHQKVFLYDPIFKSTDNFILNHYSLQTIPFNEEGKHACNERTLIYALHCGRPLYNNLLLANWHNKSLHNLALLTNSFSNIINNTPKKLALHNIPAILQLFGFMIELAVENIFRFNDIFNDTSLHFFNNNNNNNFQQQIYDITPPQPNYQNDEDIIFNTITEN